MVFEKHGRWQMWIALFTITAAAAIAFSVAAIMLQGVGRRQTIRH